VCKLFGVIANQAVDVEYSLQRFRQYARDNYDGWGIGWYQNGSGKVFKEGISALDEESNYLILSRTVKSRIIISHVRDKGKGAPASEVNAHPFIHRNWIFAHNGLVDREWLWSHLRDDGRKEVKGGTDSEVYFLWILQNIEEHEGDVAEALRKAARHAAAKTYRGLNFLLSDGTCLYALRYSQSETDKYTLFVLDSGATEPGPLLMNSADTRLIMRSKSLKGEKAVLVCSERLTDQPWQPIGFGEMLIVEQELNMKRIEIF
jgi:predicted glutamine amidotransferase